MFQAWLVNMAKMAANSAPSTRPGAKDMKNTTVTEMNPRIGTDCRMSRIGTKSLAAQVAYVRVNSRESARPANMRNVVRAAYSGKYLGSRDNGVNSSCDSGANRPREVSPRKAINPITTTNASTSQRDARSRRKT